MTLETAIKTTREPPKTIIHNHYGSNSDIQKAIKAQDANEDYKNQLSDFAKLLPKDEKKALQTAFEFFLKNIPYQEDGLSQNLKTPSRAYTDGKQGIGTDCKTFALIMAAICWHLGIKYSFKYANYSKSDGQTPRHIYTVAYLENGEKIILDIPFGIFNAEKPPHYSFEVKGSQQKPIGATDRKMTRKQKYLPFSQMTEGALLLELQKRQFELINNINPVVDYTKEIEFLDNVIERGTTAPLRGIWGLNTNLSNFIQQAAAQQQPAAFGTIGNEAAASQRRAYLNCIDAAEKAYVKDKSRARWAILTQKGKQNVYEEYGCNKFQMLEQAFNTTLEPSGAALMYSFLQQGVTHPNVVQTKERLQAFQSQKLVAVSGLSQAALKMFYRNGIIATVGSQPELVLKLMQEKGGQLTRRNIAGNKTIGVEPISATILAVAAAVSALAALFQSLKKNGFEEELSEVTTPSKQTAPDLDDWAKNPTGGEGEGEGDKNELTFWDKKLLEFLPENKVFIPTAAAAATAGFLILKPKN